MAEYRRPSPALARKVALPNWRSTGARQVNESPFVMLPTVFWAVLGVRLCLAKIRSSSKNRGPLS